MPLWSQAFLAVYGVVLFTLALFGLHRLHLSLLFLRHRGRWRGRGSDGGEPQDALGLDDSALPTITLQLPLYNERYVAERLLRASAALDYPRSKLEIQVLDDSTDETREVVDRVCQSLRREGVDIQVIRREGRAGFKAGALAFGLEQARGSHIAIFDADFIPGPSFLREVLPSFKDPKVGMVQGRWTHLNRGYNLLCQGSAVLLDGHFVVEHSARHWSGRFFNFNGTAGVWRKEAIEDGGGWQGDTLTEDLDLSYRAQLKGWRFVYLPGVTAPSELPVEMAAFKSQQHRWAKGSIQTAMKLMPTLWRSPLPLKVRLEAGIHLLNNLAHPLMLLLALLLPIASLLRPRWDFGMTLLIDGPILLSALGSMVVFYGISQSQWGNRRDGTSWRSIPLALALGAGLAVNNTRAVVEALLGQQSPFVRTPKYAITGTEGGYLDKAYRRKVSVGVAIELLLGAHFVVGIVLAFMRGRILAVPFLLLFAFGFLYVGGQTLYQSLKQPKAPQERLSKGAMGHIHPPMTSPQEVQGT